MSDYDQSLLDQLGFFDFGQEEPTLGASGVQSIENVVDITAYPNDAESKSLRMRALLDTGSTGPNMMRSGLAERLGHTIENLPNSFNYSPVVGNGQVLEPLGVVRVRWYFSGERMPHTKSYDILFLVVPDTVPYDVVLGFKFLQAEHIFMMPSLFCMTGGIFIPNSSGKSTGNLSRF